MGAFPLSPHLGCIFPQLGYPQLPLSSIGSVIGCALSYGGDTLVLRPKPYWRSNSPPFCGLTGFFGALIRWPFLWSYKVFCYVVFFLFAYFYLTLLPYFHLSFPFWLAMALLVLKALVAL